jgi:hypothetical protein
MVGERVMKLSFAHEEGRVRRKSELDRMPSITILEVLTLDNPK